MNSIIKRYKCIFRFHHMQIFLLYIQQFLGFIPGEIPLPVSNVMKVRHISNTWSMIYHLIETSTQDFTDSAFQVRGSYKRYVTYFSEIEFTGMVNKEIFFLASLVWPEKWLSTFNPILLEITSCMRKSKFHASLLC